MNFGSIFKTLFNEDGRPKQGAGEGSPADRDAAVARAYFNAAQSGGLENGSTSIAELFSSMTPAPAPQTQQAPAGVSPTTMRMIQPAAAPAINITQPTGAKPKNYTPTQISFNPGVPSMLANMGLAAPQQLPTFQMTPATGTKTKNYKPATMTVNAPRPVGPEAMAQVMAAMSGGGATPFAPYGQG